MRKYLLLFIFFFVAVVVKAQWNELGGVNGLAANYDISSICSDHLGNIYAAGYFTNSSGKSYVAKYDGTAWTELGGLNGLSANNNIFSVCADALGNIYAVGNFTNSSGYQYVAKYDGISWSELGGLNGLSANNLIQTVYSDASGNIYAAGNFTNNSGNRYVAKYNGTSWSELGGLNSLSANAPIVSVCADAFGNIYAAGWFVNNSYNYYVAKYNGVGWSELGGLNSLSANAPFYSICCDALGNVYAGGNFTNTNGLNYVAKYNGTNWSELGGLNSLSANAGITSICNDAAGNIYAAGAFSNSNAKHYVAKYNGTNWSELGGLNTLSANNLIQSVYGDASGNIYTAGNFTNTIGNRYVAAYGCITKRNSINQSICPNQTYIFNNHQLNTTGTYYDTLTNYHGCDSIITLHLIINSSQTTYTQSISAGQSYLFNGQNLTTAGTYYDTLTNYLGCDSFITLNLTIQVCPSVWSEVGGLNALAANDFISGVCGDPFGNIYAAGYFKNSSGKRYVAKYNGAIWTELGGLNSLSANSYIVAVCSDLMGNIYAAGSFTDIYGKNYVAKYNGTTWSELGGLSGLQANLTINTLCCDITGNIYAAGYFTNSSNVQSYVAQWNGMFWNSLGGNTGWAANDAIFSVCTDLAGNIYAAGNFTNGTNTSNGNKYVAKWNGTSWSELGGLNALSANGTIYTLCRDAVGNIYAAGSFTNSSGNRYVAKWNGTNWSELGGLNGLSANGDILTIYCDGSGKVYAAGRFRNSMQKRYVAQWNGTSWIELGGLNALAANGIINCICTDASGNIYTGGYFDNSTNQYVAEYNNCQMSFSPINQTACGSYTFNNHQLTASGTYYDTLVNYHGADSIVTLHLIINSSQTTYTQSISAGQSYLFNGQNLTIAGTYYDTLTNYLGCDSFITLHLQVYNCTPSWGRMGSFTRWSPFGSQVVPDIYSTCSDANGNIYTGGSFCNSAYSYFVSKYNGTNWSELGGNNTLAANGYIVTIHPDIFGNIYAAGFFTNGATNSSGNNYVAKYNGTSWSELGGLNGLAANGSINSVCSDAAGNIYAAGNFRNASYNTYVAQWNGTSWSELGGLNGLATYANISSVCSDAAGNIYAAGSFTNSSGKYYVAKWNGANWSELGGLNGLAANANISSVCSDAVGNIYAAGSFTNSSGKYYVAKWNGTSWSELGGLNSLGANNYINCVNKDGNGNIYAAGYFTNSSGNYYVAKFNGIVWSEIGGLNGLAANTPISNFAIDNSGIIYTGGAYNNNYPYYADMYKFGCIPTYGTIYQSICSNGSYNFHNRILTASGGYTDTLVNYHGADSILTLYLTIKPTSSSSITQSICSNQSMSVGLHTYNTNGTFHDTLTNYLGCDSIITLNLTVKPISNSTVNQSICSNQTYLFNAHQLSSAGTYYDTLTNYVGCDSFITLQLTIKPVSNYSINQTICSYQSVTVGLHTYNTNGTYYDTLTNYVGCDSFVILHLIVLPDSVQTNGFICQGSTYNFNGTNLNAAGIYRDTLHNQLGCDSIVVLHLNQGSVTTSTNTQSICSNQFYAFNNQQLNSPGTYYDTLTNYMGCDSIITLQLAIKPTSQYSFNQTICSNQSITVGSHTYNTAGTFHDTLTNYVGCDSFVTLQLTVKPISNHSFNQSICANQPYTFNGHQLTISGTYYDTLINYVGCDSFITLHLTVKPISNHSFSQSICNNQYYTFNGHHLNTTGTYYDTLTNYMGCDSFITLHLTAKPISNHSFSQINCANHPYTFNGHQLTTSGTYYDTLINYVGCDSFITLHLTIKPISSHTFGKTICKNNPYFFNQHWLSLSGIYKDTLLNYVGCDSFLTLNLTVLDSSLTILQTNTCSNQPVYFHQHTINTSGTYYDTLLNQFGCDSTVVLHLTVLPTSSSTITDSACSNRTYHFNHLTIDSSGIYHDTIPNYLGCDSFITAYIKLYPQHPRVTNVLGKLTAFGWGYDKLTWINCDNNQFVSSANPFDVNESGNYAVVVEQGNCSDTSACMYVDIDCHLLATPNPAKDVIHIKIKCGDKAFHLVLTDVLGRALIKQEIKNVDELELLRNELAAGVYFLYLYNEHDVKMVQKVVWE